jgi:hypothetical protein
MKIETLSQRCRFLNTLKIVFVVRSVNSYWETRSRSSGQESRRTVHDPVVHYNSLSRNPIQGQVNEL